MITSSGSARTTVSAAEHREFTPRRTRAGSAGALVIGEMLTRRQNNFADTLSGVGDHALSERPDYRCLGSGVPVG